MTARVAPLLIALVGLMPAGSSVRAARQVVHDDHALSPVPRRVVETLYSETTHRTEVGVTITPHSAQGFEIPVNLVLAAAFKGDLTRAVPIRTAEPVEISLLAAASPTAVLRTALPAITLAGDGGRVLTLSPPGAPVLYGAPCDQCSDTSVRLLLTARTLLDLAASHEVTGTVLGIPAHLDREDLDAIRVFAYYIGVWK